jgi:hypothetical protein
LECAKNPHSQIAARINATGKHDALRPLVLAYAGAAHRANRKIAAHYSDFANAATSASASDSDRALPDPLHGTQY